MIWGDLDDRQITFNLRRTSDNYGPPRKNAVLPSAMRKVVLIPGFMNSEKNLIRNIESYFNLEKIKLYSFCIAPHLFSMAFRFRRDDAVLEELINLHPMNTSEEKLVKKALKSCLDHLKNGLNPGAVYLIPDTEVSFGQADRFARPYSRYVLIFKADSHAVTFIPFTTQTHRINADEDILFDKQWKGSRLDANGQPTVDNFPYKIFRKSVVLRVMAAQTITPDAFLAIALSQLGAVNKDVIEFVRTRLKQK